MSDQYTYIPRHRADADFPPEYMTPEQRPPTRRIEIWAEGYAASGDKGDATYCGFAIARNFDQAVIDVFGVNDSLLKKNADGTWTHWGCRLFDNEFQARQSFG